MAEALDRPTLTEPERVKLGDLEQIIEHGMETFVQVGAALSIIRDQKLYRAEHDTFESYCQDRWSMGASRARQLIGASDVVQKLGSVTTGNTPSTERVARELAALPEDKRAEVWEQAQAAAEGKKPTAQDVRKAAAPYRPISERVKQQRGKKDGSSPAGPQQKDSGSEAGGLESTGEPAPRSDTESAPDGTAEVAREVGAPAGEPVPPAAGPEKVKAELGGPGTDNPEPPKPRRPKRPRKRRQPPAASPGVPTKRDGSIDKLAALREAREQSARPAPLPGNSPAVVQAAADEVRIFVRRARRYIDVPAADLAQHVVDLSLDDLRAGHRMLGLLIEERQREGERS